MIFTTSDFLQRATSATSSERILQRVTSNEGKVTPHKRKLKIFDEKKNNSKCTKFTIKNQNNSG